MRLKMIVLGLVFVVGCGESEQDYAKAIRAAIEQDRQASLELKGSVGLWEAIVGIEPGKIDKYVSSVKAIDMSRCPPDFRLTYQSHIRTWENFAMGYRAGHKTSSLEKAVEDSWLVVNDCARKYGVTDALK